MDVDTVWSHTHRARGALTDLLRGLDEAAWNHDSLCAGWTVRDVAAHVTASAETGWADLAALLWRGRFSFNRAVFLDAKRRAEAPIEEILAVHDRIQQSRRHVVVTTHVEPLVDILVHTQDIARPLGIEVCAPSDAAAFAADRARLVAPVMGTWRLLRNHRLVATDIDWTRGRGTTIEAPTLELLMLCTGRPARLSQ